MPGFFFGAMDHSTRNIRFKREINCLLGKCSRLWHLIGSNTSVRLGEKSFDRADQ